MMATQYDRPDLEWTQHIFLQNASFDIGIESLYNPEKGEYTDDDGFFNKTEQRLGKVDPCWYLGMSVPKS